MKKSCLMQDDREKSLHKKKPPAKVCNRKSSNVILFGEDSDSEKEEIVLISDGCSSSETKRKKDRDQKKSTNKLKSSATASKKDKNGHTNVQSMHKACTKKNDKKMDPKHLVSSQFGQKESQIKPQYSIIKDSRKDKTSDKMKDHSNSNEKTCFKKRISYSPGKVLNAVMKYDDSGHNITHDSDEDITSANSSDEDYEALSNCDVNDEPSFSESDTFEECLRIFQEESSKQSCKVQQELDKFKEPEECKKEDLVLSSLKQRVAHVSRFDVSKHKKYSPRPNARPSPLQVCHNRYMQAQQHLKEQHTPKQDTPRQDTRKLPSTPEPTSGTCSTSSKKRIAHIPSLQLRQTSPNKSPLIRSPSIPVMGINAKIQMKYSIGHPSKTVAITAPKGERRLAHLPKKVNPRPIIPPDTAGKVPSNVRQRYLNLFIDEFLKNTRTEQDAFDQGLKEEKSVYERATSKNIYLNLSVNTLNRLRNAQTDVQSKVTSPTSKGSISHEAVIGGKPATQHTFTLNRSHQHPAQQEKYEGKDLYEILKTYVLTEDQLVENGYPRPSTTPGLAVIKARDTKKSTVNDPNQHVCSRCGKTFLRRPDGHYITRENCIYHWGKFWHNKVGGSLESLFNCCSGDSSAKGCSVAKYHVTEDKTNNLTGFMKTVAKSPPADGNPGVYAMDCEMCYTAKSLELTRVTVIDDKLNCVYDTLVKPTAEIVDYNTRFSGITEDDLKCVTTSLQDVQAVLLSMFSSDSILIGHSLESDVLSLKMIHSTVIDTAVLFPHRRGLPFKRALRTLMAECLNRIIQNDVGGHDSKEDARSCMELMIWKAKQDVKKRKTYTPY